MIWDQILIGMHDNTMRQEALKSWNVKSEEGLMLAETIVYKHQKFQNYVKKSD